MVSVHCKRLLRSENSFTSTPKISSIDSKMYQYLCVGVSLTKADWVTNPTTSKCSMPFPPPSEKKFYLFFDLFISLHSLCISKPWCVDDGEGVVNTGALHRMDGVCSDVICDTFCLLFSVFDGHFETEIVVPFNSKDVVDHTIDKCAFSCTSCIHYHQHLMPYVRICGVACFHQSQIF